MKCFICNGPHRARQCPNNPNRGNFSKPEKSSGGAALVATAYTIRENRVEKNEDSAVLKAFSASIQESEWYVDSGTTSHMTNKRDWLKDYRENSKRLCANNKKLSSEGVESATVRITELDDLSLLRM